MRSRSEKYVNVKTISKAKLLKWAVHQALDPISHHILLTLVASADGNGQCRLSASHLARITGLSRRSVFGALKTLDDGGLIKRSECHRGDNSRAANLVTLQCTTCTTPSAPHAPPPQCTSCTPLGEVSISTKVDRFVLEDRSHPDNKPEYQDERVSEGVVDRWWDQPFSETVDVTCGGLL